jgi:predicted ferric reductase
MSGLPGPLQLNDVKRMHIQKLHDEGFTVREIESITGIGYMSVQRVTKGRKRPEPTKSVYASAPPELKKALDRALKHFEMSQTPANWSALQDARREYEDHLSEQKRLALHR